MTTRADPLKIGMAGSGAFAARRAAAIASSPAVTLGGIASRAAVRAKRTEGALTIREPLLGARHVADRADAMEGPGRWDSVLRRAPGLVGRARAEKHPYAGDPYHPQSVHLAELVRDGATEGRVVTHALGLGIARLIEETRVR